MKTILQKITAALFVTALSMGATAVQAQDQNRIEGAVQQGRGAYVQKTDRAECITNTLLGIPGVGTCLDMTQVKFMVTPSGNAMSVWKGTVAETARPKQRIVHNSTWSEANNDGVTRTYATVAETTPDGSVTLTLNDKQNGGGKTKMKGKK